MSKKRFMLLRRLHGRIHEVGIRKKIEQNLYKNYITPYLEKAKKSKCVFLVLTPEHTNLGDHAIAISEIELLRKCGIDYVEITGHQLEEFRQNRLLGLMNSYPILINGGGNLGTLWFGIEQLMRDIIKSNPKSEIIIMPNTFYYEDTAWGREELSNSIRLYNKHKRLHIYARENTSFERMKSIYKDVHLTPDMVLSQNKCVENTSRNGCLLCLRNDREKTITDSEKEALLKNLTMVFGSNIKYTDTHSIEPVLPKDRKNALEQKYSEFRDSKLVITDRLHGMIFAAITGTPCIVINSQSPKVLGCYEWIKNLNYIKFCNDVSTIADVINSIADVEYKYDETVFEHYFETLGKNLLDYTQSK